MFPLMHRVLDLISRASAPLKPAGSPEPIQPLATTSQRAALQVALTIPDLDAVIKSAIKKYLDIPIVRQSDRKINPCEASVAEPVVTPDHICFQVQGRDVFNVASCDIPNRITTPVFSPFASPTLSVLDNIIEVDCVEEAPKIPRLSLGPVLNFFGPVNTIRRDSAVTVLDFPQHEDRFLSIPSSINELSSHDSHEAETPLICLPVDIKTNEPVHSSLSDVPIRVKGPTALSFTHLVQEDHHLRETLQAPQLPPGLMDVAGFPDMLSSPQYFLRRKSNSPAGQYNVLRDVPLTPWTPESPLSPYGQQIPFVERSPNPFYDGSSDALRTPFTPATPALPTPQKKMLDILNGPSNVFRGQGFAGPSTPTAQRQGQFNLFQSPVGANRISPIQKPSSPIEWLPRLPLQGTSPSPAYGNFLNIPPSPNGLYTRGSVLYTRGSVLYTPRRISPPVTPLFPPGLNIGSHRTGGDEFVFRLVQPSNGANRLNAQVRGPWNYSPSWPPSPLPSPQLFKQVPLPPGLPPPGLGHNNAQSPRGVSPLQGFLLQSQDEGFGGVSTVPIPDLIKLDHALEQHANEISAFSSDSDPTCTGSSQRGGVLVRTEDGFSVTLLKELGSGGFGKVIRGVRGRTSGKGAVAVKILHKRNQGKHGPMFIAREVQVLRQITLKFDENPESGFAFLLKLIRSWQGPEDIFIVTNDYYGDLRGILHDRTVPLGVSDIRFYAAELVLALEALHSLPALHRDIKPDNVLISPTGHLVLADFGLAKLGSSAHECCGTTGYMSPEVFTLSDTIVTHGTPADIWSMGILFLEMFLGNGETFLNQRNPQGPNLLGRPPRGKETADERDARIDRNAYNLDSADVEACVGRYDGDAVSLISSMVKRRPEMRATIDKIKKHRFFACLEWGKVARRQYIPSHRPGLPPQEKASFEKFEWSIDDDVDYTFAIHKEYQTANFDYDGKHIEDPLHETPAPDAGKLPRPTSIPSPSFAPVIPRPATTSLGGLHDSEEYSYSVTRSISHRTYSTDSCSY